MVNGFFTKDFSFITNLPIIGRIIGSLPHSVISSDRSLFFLLLTIFVLAALLKNIFRYLSMLSMSYFSARSLHHLRRILFGRYLSFGKLFFDRTNVGHHSTVLLQFTGLALRPILMIDKYINALFSLLGYLVIMSVISWKLTAFAIPLFAVLHLSVHMMLKRLQRLSRSIAEQGSLLGKKTIEILSTIPLVKSYNAEDFEQRRFGDISNEKATLDFRSGATEQLLLPLQETITLLAAVILFSGMLYLMVRQGTSTAPAFIVYFYLVLNAASKFGLLTGFRAVLASSRGPLDEILAVFSDEGKHFVPTGKKVFPGLKDRIELRNLSFQYAVDREILRDVSFSIRRGELTALVGPTGSGKTTLINLLLRFYECEPGMIFLDGTDIREFKTESLREHFALVSQETFLFHDTLRQNITYGATSSSAAEVRQVVERARLSDYVSKLPAGLETLIGDRGTKLSGGEKQRVSIARALLKGAEILILDEATSSLDSQTERLIQEAIDEVIRGKTAIVIAHRLSTIQHADRIVVLEGGRMVEQGTLMELLGRKGRFFVLWEEQKFA
jgi:subfamily B ATP-binding cassette protein MsbA